MNKKLSRVWATIIACSLLLTGCAGEASTSSQSGGSSSTTAPTSSGTVEESNYNPVGEMPIVKEQVALTAFVPSRTLEEPYAENRQIQYLEELTNIKLEWVENPIDQINSKMNLMFAGGDVTDIIYLGTSMSSRLDKSSEALLGVQGLIMPLNEFYETKSVGYKAVFEELDGMKEFMTTPDGNIYSLPTVDGSLHVQYNMKMWINTVWLDNLNLEMPTTTEEFEAVMKAFKEQDANGNGDPNDEIPFSTCKSGAGTQIDGFLMNPFQLTPENTRMYLEDGTVTFSPVTDDYREGLRWINSMYEAGYINPESFTQERANQVNVNENGDYPVIGVFVAQRPGYAADLSTTPYSEVWEQYQPMAPLEGPSGEAIAAWSPYIMFATGSTFISSTCEEPEAAFRLIDYMATEEGSIMSAFGFEGEHYELAEDGELGLNGEQAVIKRISHTDTNYNLGQFFGLVRTPYMTEFLVTNPDPYAEGVTPLDGRQVLMYNNSVEHEAVQQPLESVLPDLYQSTEDAEEMSLLKTTIMDYTTESIIRFVAGDLDIEIDWDNYINQLNTLGLPRYIELLQIAYDQSAFAD